MCHVTEALSPGAASRAALFAARGVRLRRLRGRRLAALAGTALLRRRALAGHRVGLRLSSWRACITARFVVHTSGCCMHSHCGGLGAEHMRCHQDIVATPSTGLFAVSSGATGRLGRLYHGHRRFVAADGDSNLRPCAPSAGQARVRGRPVPAAAAWKTQRTKGSTGHLTLGGREQPSQRGCSSLC